MVVIDTISYSVHFPSYGQKISVEGSSFDIFERIEHQESSEYHPVSDLLVGSSESYSSLHEIDVV